MVEGSHARYGVAKKMLAFASAPPSLLHKVWEYPLFEALFGRRSRRFGLGAAGGQRITC